MSEKDNVLYEFGDFRLDPVGKALYHSDSPVSLKPKIVDTLTVLVENAGEIVSKDDLMNSVWQDTFVAENNLSVNIYALRKVFAGFDGETQFIQTVPRRGFRFALPVSRVARKNGNGVPVFNESGAASDIGQPHLDTALFEAPITTTRTSIFHKSRLTMAAFALIAIAVIGSGIYLNRAATPPRRDEIMAPHQTAANNGTMSEEARSLYLRGYELWKTRDNREMYAGAELFRRAIEIDPNFVAPYIGLADSYSMMTNNPAHWRLADEYANKALRLAPNSAEVHASLGFIAAMNKWQWREAENLFKRALELDPRSAKAHHWYANSLLIERRFDEAEDHLKRAIAIDPLSPNYNRDLAELYTLMRRDPEMREQCQRLDEINPGLNFGVCSEYGLALRDRRYDEAARMMYEGTLQDGRTREQVENSGWYKAYKVAGWRSWLAWEIEQIKTKPDAYNATFNLSLKYAEIGDRENALRSLEKAVDEHLFLLPFINVRSEFDGLRDDPEFQNIVHRIGLNQ